MHIVLNFQDIIVIQRGIWRDRCLKWDNNNFNEQTMCLLGGGRMIRRWEVKEEVVVLLITLRLWEKGKR